MKNRSTVIFILVVFAVAAGFIVFFAIFDNSNDEELDWFESYLEIGNDPYGSLVLHELLSTFPSSDPLIDLDTTVAASLPIDTSGASNFIFLGESAFFDSLDVQQLSTFVAAGNQAFIFSKTIPKILINEIYTNNCTEEIWQDYDGILLPQGRLTLEHPALQLDAAYVFEYYSPDGDEVYLWNYIDSAFICNTENSFVPLGLVNQQFVNFARLRFGDGYFYFHTNPILFSNFALLKEEGRAYANRVLRHLPPGTKYWDTQSRVEEYVGRRLNDLDDNRGVSESPLKFILTHRSLAWAWYLGLGAALLYLIFRAKRKQREIPVIEEIRNTSLDFINATGTLYYLQKNHKRLATQKMNLFLGFLRNRYHLDTVTLDTAFVKNLASTAQVEEAVIEKILLLNENIHNTKAISEVTLVAFHEAIENFYRECK